LPPEVPSFTLESNDVEDGSHWTPEFACSRLGARTSRRSCTGRASRFISEIPGEPSLWSFDALESRPDFHVLAEKTLQRYRRKPIFRPNGESRWFGRGAMDAGSTGLPSRSTSCSTESCRGAGCEQLQRLEVTLDQCWDLLLPAPGPPGGRPRPRPAGVGDEGTVCRRLHRL